MDVLWRSGRATVGEIAARIGAPPLAYNTVLSTMRTLEQKGYVAHEEDGRAFVYRPLVAQKQAANSAVRQLVRRFFGDSPGELAVQLLDDTKLTEEDVARVQRALSRRRKASR